MNRQFMKELYERTFKDPLMEVMQESPDYEEYKKVKDEFADQDTAVYALLDSAGREKYDHLNDLGAELIYQIAMTFYLRGAEDREKMLQ